MACGCCEINECTHNIPALSTIGTFRKDVSALYASRFVLLVTRAVTAPPCDVNVACRRLDARSKAVGDPPVTTSACCAATTPSTASLTVIVSSRRGVNLAAHVLSV